MRFSFFRLVFLAMSTPADNNTSAQNANKSPTPSTSVWPKIELPSDPEPKILHSGKHYRQIEAVESLLNYCDDHVHDMYTRRDMGGTDSALEGASWVFPRVFLTNARLAERAKILTLHQNGFQLIENVIPKAKSNPIDFTNGQEVTERYYPLCESLLKGVFAGQEDDDKAPVLVRAFDHNLRVSGSKCHDAEGNTVLQQPLGVVHNDYTHVSAPRRLEQLGQLPKANDALKSVLGDQSLLDPTMVQEVLDGKRRFCFVNVWRNMDREEAVQQFPLACASADTVSMDDLLTFSIIYADRVGENYFSRFSKNHHWNYFPQMKHSEALLIKQWDSHGTLARQKETSGNNGDASQPFCSTFSLHSAFQDPTNAKDAPPRKSIEVRCVLIWDLQ